MRVVLLGGAGHASDVLGAIEAFNDSRQLEEECWIVVGILADVEVDPKRFAARGIKHIGTTDDLKRVDAGHYIACAGYPKDRKVLADRADAVGLKAATVIHPKAWVPKNVVIGKGTIVLAGACVSPLAVFGDHAYISHGSLVGHDAQVDNYVSVMPGASVSGDTHLGEGCLIGSNATVLEKLTIGAWSIVGAGSLVTKDVPANVTAVGAPARWK